MLDSEAVEKFGRRVVSPANTYNGRHVTRAHFDVSTLTLRVDQLKLILKGIR
jgi:hypothetical protein